MEGREGGEAHLAAVLRGDQVRKELVQARALEGALAAAPVEREARAHTARRSLPPLAPLLDARARLR